MKTVFSFISAVILLLLLPALTLPTTYWQPVPGKYAVDFKIKNADKWATGNVGGVRGDIKYDPAKPLEGSINILIDPLKVITGNTLRDDHLRSPEYLGVVKHPIIQYTCSKFTQKRKKIIANGYLKIKEFSKPVDIEFTVENQDSMLLFKGKMEVNRLDFNIGYKSKTLKNKVYLNIVMPCRRKK